MYFFFSVVTPKKVYLRTTKKTNQICRLCGKETLTKRLTHVFQKAGKSKDLHQMILKAAGIFISENDMLPKVICRPCERQVISNIDFRKSCNKNQVSFLNKC